MNCMKALGMASYSTSANSPMLAAQARQYYVAAIQATNAAITAKSSASQDATLLAVIALSYFESISGNDARSIEAWSQHIQGTSALIQLRGIAQLETGEGRLLFMQATTCLITDCMRAGVRAPKFIHEYMDEMSRRGRGRKDPMLRVHEASLQLLDLKMDIISGASGNTFATIEKILGLDSIFASAFADASSVRTYEVVTCHATAESELPAYFHIYQNSLTAQVRNAMRSGRIVCHALVAALLRRGNSESLPAVTQKQLADSRGLMRQLQMEIMATVSQHLGFESISRHKACNRMPAVNSYKLKESLPAPSMEMFNTGDLAPSRLPMLRSSRGKLLLWALALAGKVSAAGSPFRNTVCDLLDLAGGVLGMSQAFRFATRLREDHPTCKVLASP